MPKTKPKPPSPPHRPVTIAKRAKADTGGLIGDIRRLDGIVTRQAAQLRQLQELPAQVNQLKIDMTRLRESNHNLIGLTTVAVTQTNLTHRMIKKMYRALVHEEMSDEDIASEPLPGETRLAEQKRAAELYPEPAPKPSPKL